MPRCAGGVASARDIKPLCRFLEANSTGQCFIRAFCARLFGIDHPRRTTRADNRDPVPYRDAAPGPGRQGGGRSHVRRACRRSGHFDPNSKDALSARYRSAASATARSRHAGAITMTTHSPMSCAQIDELLPEYSTGELDGPQSRAIEEHARTCEACAREIAHWTHATGLVKRAAAECETPAVAFQTRLRASRFASVVRPLAFAASLALAFGLGIFAGRSGSTSTPRLATETRESIASRYREAAAASPGSSSLGLALMSIARRN